MARYTIDEVGIEGMYPVEEILELAMDCGVNAHGTLTYGGLITADTAILMAMNSKSSMIFPCIAAPSKSPSGG